MTLARITLWRLVNFQWAMSNGRAWPPSGSNADLTPLHAFQRLIPNAFSRRISKIHFDPISLYFFSILENIRQNVYNTIMWICLYFERLRRKFWKMYISFSLPSNRSSIFLLYSQSHDEIARRILNWQVDDSSPFTIIFRISQNHIEALWKVV